MNILDLQDKLKNLSEQQLVQEMQMPTGQMPQFLVLSEITRRKKMRDAFAQEQMKDGTTTVAQDVVAAAGMPTAFAGQMAGAMAPQTDMATNSGAMPQQSAMPAPVQGMAGGGIVALQEGGRVGGTPQLVVRGGRQFAEMPDGSLIPLSELGFDEAELSGAGTADLAAPSSGVRQGPIPSQSDLDRRFRDEAVGISGVPSQLSAYGAGAMDAVLPGAEEPVLRGGGDAVAATKTLAGLRGPDMEAARSYPPMVQAPRTPQEIPLNVMEQLYADEQARRGPQSRRPEVTIRDSAQDVAAREAADALDTFEENFDWGAGQTGPGVMERIFGAPALERIGVETSRTPKPEPTAPAGDGLPPADEPVAPIDVVTPPVAPVAGTGGGAGGPGGGGIAAAAGAGAPSSFEQELLNMLGAREKRAEQDKWLALAQAGMALMSSSQPTFGGALGEAGASGLAALREGQSGAEADRLALLGQIEQSRMSREELALRRQAAAARGAGGDGLRAKDFITILMNAEKAAREEAATLAPTGIPEPQNVAQYEAALARADAARQQYAPMLGLTPSSGTTGAYSVRDLTQ